MSLNTCRSLRSGVCASAAELRASSETNRVANSVFIRTSLTCRGEARRRTLFPTSRVMPALLSSIGELRRCDVSFARADRQIRIAQLDADRVPAAVLEARARITGVRLLA